MLFNTILGIVSFAVADGAPADSSRRQIGNGIAAICLFNTIKGISDGDTE